MITSTNPPARLVIPTTRDWHGFIFNPLYIYCIHRFELACCKGGSITGSLSDTAAFWASGIASLPHNQPPLPGTVFNSAFVVDSEGMGH